MNRRKCTDGFHFHNNCVIYKHINSIPCIELKVTEDDGLNDLSPHYESALSEFVGQTMLVSRFQKPRPKHLVNFEPRIDYCCCHSFHFG